MSPDPKHSYPINSPPGSASSLEHVSIHGHHTPEELWDLSVWNQTFNEVQSVFTGPAVLCSGLSSFRHSVEGRPVMGT